MVPKEVLDLIERMLGKIDMSNVSYITINWSDDDGLELTIGAKD